MLTRITIAILLAAGIPATLPAQISSSANAEATEKTLPATFHCGDRDDLAMSHKDKACYWWTHSFTATMLLGAAFNSALDPVFNNDTNKYWGQGVEGYSRRFGTRVGQSMANGTGQAVIGAMFKEDPRFYVSRKEGFWPRFGFALTHTLIVKNDRGHDQFSAGRVGGAFASGFIGMAWTPGPINTTQAAFERTGTAMGGVLAGSLWKEFEPDLMGLVSRIFRKPPPKAPKSPKTTAKMTEAKK